MPTIISDGGGATASVSLAEDRLGVTRVVAIDNSPTTITYSIVGGADQFLFQINATTGLLAFVGVPNFEAPADTDHDNAYLVQVQASNGVQTTTQTITVNVTDANDVTGTAGADFLVGNASAQVLDGLGGADQLLGNAGHDTFLINRPTDGIDSLLDFWSGDDVIGLDQIGFGIGGNGSLAVNGVNYVVGTAATTTAPTIIFNPTTSTLFWDADGTGAGAPVAFARFDPGSTVVWAGTIDLGTHGGNYQIAGTGDFDGNGTTDVIWRNPTTGQIDEWHMVNGNWGGSIDLGTHGPDYQVAGVGDFNHNGTSDILWRNASTGQVDLWLMVGGNWSSSVNLGSHGTSFQVAGVGDFNGDGTADILWRNASTGQVDLWLMNNGNWSSSVDLGSHGTDYQVAGIGDFNGDGTSDILWRNSATGQVDEWKMQSGNWAGSVDLGNHGTAWQVGGVADLNGNGTSDILWRNPTTAEVDGWVMSNGNWAGSTLYSTAPDAGWVVSGTGDFNGDGVGDVLWRNPTTGQVNEWHLVRRPIPTANDFNIEGNIVPNVSIPVDTDAAANTVTEGDPNGTHAGITASSTNPSGAAVTYSLSDSAGGRFAIDPNTGVVTIANAALINFETAPGAGPSYNITVMVQSGTLVNQRVFSINVGDVAPGAPSDSDGGTNTVVEGATTGAVVGITVQAPDINGGPLTYSLTDDAGGNFIINGATGVVSVSAFGAAHIDFESTGPGHTYSITAQASDGLNTSPTQSFSITVTNANPSVPTDSNGASGGSIQEGSAQGTLVGITASSTDPAGTTIVYSLTDSASGKFQIDSSTGVVSAGVNAGTIDFETGSSSYNITVQASDGVGGTSTQTFAVAVTNANPSVPTDSNGASGGSIQEGAAQGTLVGITASSTDPGGTAIAYSLTDDAGGLFTIDSSSGVVSVTAAGATGIDFELSGGSYSITAQASDGHGGTSTQTFAIAVTDVAPANWSDANAGAETVVEDAANGTLVGISAHATDVNGGTVHYTFASSADSANGAFAIDLTSGVVTVADHTKVDFESAPGHSYHIVVTGSTVGGTATSTNGFDIAVQDVAPSTPTDTDAAGDSGGISGTVVEGAIATTAVGITAHSTDVNGAGVGGITYSLTNDAGGLFTINSSTGVVSVTAAGATGIDFESTGPGHTYSITVSASDGSQASTQNFTIAVTDAAPSQPTDADGNANTVSTAAADNSPVGVTLSSTDPNTGTVTYALTDNHSNDFDINPTTGVVFLKAGHQDLTPFAGTLLTVTGVAKDPSLATSVSQDFQIFVANNALNVDLDLNNSTATGNAYLGTGANAFSEQGSAKPIADTDVTITNTGNPGVTNATSATILLTNAQIGDALTVNGVLPGGITSTTTTSAGTITVTLTGTASYANYQTALQQIQFSTTGDPTANAPNATDRLLHVTVTDSTGSSPFALSTVQITPVNDAPVLASNSSPQVTFTENGVTVAPLTNGTVTDPDHPADFSTGSFTVAITGGASAGDQVVLLGGTLFAVNGTTLLHDGNAVGTLSGLGTATASVTAFTAAATPTVVNELVKAFGYRSVSEDPSTADRTLTFTFNDGGHTGTGGALNNAVVVTNVVHVAAVNDAPTAVNDIAATQAEDTAAPWTITGASLIANDFTGPSGVNEAGQTLTVIGANNAVGGSVGVVAGNVVFTPTANFNGAASFDYTVQDNGTGSLTSVGHVTFTVTEVNDAPTANADTLVAHSNEDVVRVITAAELIGNDSTGPANESSQHLTVTSASGGVGGTVALVNGEVVFTPTANFSGTAGFDYIVTDDGTTNGVAAPLASASAHVTFTIDAVNDAPVNTVPFATQMVAEGATNFAISGISFSDVDNGAGTYSVSLTTSHGDMHVTLQGSAFVALGGNDSHFVALSGSLADLDATLATLKYSPDGGYTGPDTLQFFSEDNSQTGPGGSKSDTDTVAIQVNTPVQTGLSGELFYVTRESPTAGDNVVGQINSNDAGTGTSAIHFPAGSNDENDIGVDTVAGYYFVLDGLNNTLKSYALGGHTAAHSVAAGAGADTIDAIAVDTFYDVIYVSSVVSADAGHTGIKEFTYDAAGNLTDSGNFLINQTTTASFAEAVDMTIDSGNHLLYYVNDDVGSQNAIYVVNVFGSAGAGATPATTASNAGSGPPVTLLTDISQFAADGSNGFIEAVTFDNRGTSGTNDDIVYFLTNDTAKVIPGTASLWYLDRSDVTHTAHLVTSAPALAGAGPHTGLSFDPSTHQIWISNQDTAGNTDSIIKAQLDANGHAVTGTPVSYDLTALTGVATPDGATVPGQTAFATLPSITVHNTSYTETNPTSTPVLIDPNFLVTDPDLLITGATITLTGGFVGSGDALDIVTTGVAVTVDSNTTDANGNITLVLTGVDTPVDYFSIIRNSLTFVSGDNPTNFGHNTTRTITWHFSDGAFGDPYGDSNTKTSTITITAANDAPVANAGANSGNEDHVIVGQAVATDVDNTPAQLTYSLTGANGGALHGTVTITAAGAYVYTPAANYNGPDSFQFHVNDGTVDSNDGTISLTVNAVNDAPTVTATTLAAVNEDDVVPPGATVSSLFSGHFSDIDAGSSFAGIAVSGNTADFATQGVWQYSLNGSVWFAIGPVSDASALALTAASFLRFVPAVNFNGTPPSISVYGLDNTFAGTFTTSGSPSLIDASVNGGTTAISDNSVAISTSVTSVNDLPALTLDFDSSSPATGADFDVSYSVSGPAVAISDTDTTITDADNTSIVSAHVVLTNAQTNDTLAISGALPFGISAVITPGVGTITVDLSGAASLAAYQTALHQIVFNNPLAAGTPAGDRTVTVTVNDGTDNSNTATTTIHVTQDSAPTAVDDTSAIAAGTATVAATATVNDTDAQDPSSALVVNAIRTGTEAAGTGTAGTVGNALVGQYGALTLNFDGTYTYQLDNNNAAVQAANSTDHLHDFFTYTVRDTAGLTDLAQIDIDITGANDPPVANPDAVSATEAGGPGNTTAGVNPSGNVVTDVGPGKDTDPDNDTLTVQGVALGTQAGPLSGNVNTGLSGAGAANFGTLTIDSLGNYTYVVNQTNTTIQALRTFAQTQTDTFSYTINDGQGHTATTQVTVTIHGQDDDPVAVTDTASATEAGGTANGTAGSNPSGNVLTNDTDVDSVGNGETQTVQGVAAGDVHLGPALTTGVAAPIGGSYGTLTVNSNGSFGYVVNQSLADSLNSTDHPVDTFTYTMHDADGHTSTALINVTVNGVNDAPVANADGTFVVFENRATSPTANVLTNDTDVDTSSASFTAIKNTDTAHGGTVTVNTNGTFSVSYASNSNYLGTDTFTYHTNDNGSPNLSSGAATVTVDVQPVVWHIDNAHGPDATQDGTAAHPFQSIAAFNTANAAAGTHPDIVYLHFGTGTYATTDGITLNNGQTLLGQGVDLTYTKTDTTLVTLLDADNSQIPTITASAGSAVHLASGNTIAGFNVGNTTAAGIIDNGGTVGNLAISNIAINDTGQALSITHGGTLSIDTAHGGVTTQSFSSVTSSNSTGEGISLGGGAGTLGGSLVIGTTSVTDATGNAIHVSNTAAGASFNFGNTTVNDTVVGGHTGNGINLATGIGATNTFTFSNISEKTDGGYGLTANGGTLSIGGTASTIDAHGGAAIDLTGTSLTAGGATFATVSSAGSATYGINLVNQTTGAFTANAGTIGTADTAGVHISGGTTAATINTTINSSNGEAIDISGHATGTLAFGGTITHTSNTDVGINVINNTSGAINFTGQTSITTTTAAGVNLATNGTAAISFNDGGNGLDISTGSGTGFNATGGGTVNVTQAALGTNSTSTAGNTINSTSGTALNIANTTIGASNVTFQSISSGSGANSGTTGIILDTTGASGGLHVTGIDGVDAGTVVDAGSGGTIQHKTGADGNTSQGTGIYLNSTKDVQLNGMQLNDFQNYGILGTTVNGLSLDHVVVNGTNGTSVSGIGEGSAYFTGLSGSATVSSSTFTGAVADAFHLFNNGETLNRITFTGDTFATNTAAGNASGDALGIQATGGTMNVTVQSSTFTSARSDLFQLNLLGTVSSDLVFGGATAALGNTLTNNNLNIVSGGGGVTIGGGGPSNNITLTYNIAHNSISGSHGAVLAVTKGTGTNGSFTGTIDSNTIGTQGSFGSGSTQGEGIAVFQDGAGTNTVAITNNHVSGVVGGRGAIDVFVHNGASGKLAATIQGNTIDTLDQANSFAGIYAQTGSNTGAGGDNNLSNLTISGNNINIGPNSASNLVAGIVLEQEGVSKVGVLGTPTNYAGTPYDFTAVQNYVAAKNTITAPNGIPVFAFGDSAKPAGGGYFGAAQFLLAASGGVASASNTVGETNLTQDDVNSIVGAAIAHWAAAGASASQLAVLQNVTIDVAPMSGTELGLATAGHITLDNNAGGLGWFVDPTPFDNAEFANVVSNTHGFANPTEAAAGHVDLLTTVMHELGHQIGLVDLYDVTAQNDLMYGALETGERRLPDAADVFAAQQNAVTHLDAPIIVNEAASGPSGPASGASGGQTIAVGGAGAAVAHIASYSAAQGDVFDFSALQVADAARVRVVEDATDAFATLQVDTGGGIVGRGGASNAHWESVAQVDGVHAGDAVNVLLDPAHVAQLHAGYLV